MKLTVDLPDDLIRTVKIRAVDDGHKLKDEIAVLIRRGLASAPSTGRPRSGRVRLPLVQCAHPATAATEMTPSRVAEILLEEESGRAAR